MKLPVLCKGEISEKPYIFKSISIRVFSLEEICRVFMEHTSMPPEDFYCVELCDYISFELKLKDLGDALKESLMKKTGGQSEFIVRVLMYSGYADNVETEKIRKQISMLENLPPLLRMKSYADSMVSSGRLYGAFDIYNEILPKIKGKDPALEASIYHNCGVVYAKMFFFEAAAAQFKEAYVISRDEESLRAYKAAALFSDDDTENLIKERIITPKDAEEIGRIKEKILEGAAGDVGDIDFANDAKRIVKEIKKDYLKRIENGIISADIWGRQSA